jgi:exonuclease III
LFQIGTYNVNTMREESKAAELEQMKSKAGVEILGIQEHRIVLADPLNLELKKIGSSYLITSSGWRNSMQAAQGGVGLLLGRKARKSLLDAKRISQRILLAEFDGNPKMTVIVVYAPTNCADLCDIKDFYNTLRNTLQDVPAHNFLAVIGDFNARIGRAIAQHAFHQDTNRSGHHLVDVLNEFGLIPANALFQKRLGKRWTFKDRASEELRQLDYILVRRKWRKSIHNAEAYNTFSTLGSDHRPVIARIRLSLRTAKQARKIKYDWKAFSASPAIQEQYTVAVKNRFQALEGDDNGTSYDKFVEANQLATEECVPQKPKKRTVHTSSDPRIAEAREVADEAHEKWISDDTEASKISWKEALSHLYDLYDQITAEELEQRTRDIEAAHDAQKYGEAWQVVNEITGRKKAKEAQVSGSSPEERVKTWFSHFKNLLGSPASAEDTEEELPNIFEDLEIDDGPFTIEEYRKVKSSLKAGKAAGPDGIPPDVLKSCDFDDICLEFCNKALLENDKPDLWSFMNIVPVPKSGNLSNTNNYRGISLICIIAKLYNRLILNRIRGVLDVRLRINQNGFRPKRSTVGQILTLRRIIEGVKDGNLPAIITFIDFKKAFDTIHRGKMMKILRAYGIPPNILRAIEKMYSNTQAKVITPDGETEQFEITAGVLQGDTLAPFLFIIVLDYALRRAIDGREEELGFTLTPRRSRRHPKEALTDLDFADDIALLSDAVKQAQELLLRVEEECAYVGLGLNGPKTKYLKYNIDDNTPLRTSDGTVLECKDDFKYLGSWVDSTEKDIAVRKALAWYALNGMIRIWKSNMQMGLKKRFFVACIESILLYGCEAWAMTVKLEKSLNGTYTRMLRKALNIHWSSHTRNEELYGDLPAVSDKIASRRLQLAGHCYRHPELSAQQLVLWEPKHGHRNRGRPKTTFVDTLRRDTGTTVASEIGTMMADRECWRGHVRSRLRPP